MLRYRVKLTQDDGAVVVSFPEVPGALTFGDDETEALARAVDALETMFIGLIEDRQPIPRPRHSGKGKSVIVPVLTEAKVELYNLMRAQNVGKTELARWMNCNPAQIDRLLDLRHASRLDRLEQAFRAIGKRLEVAVADAA